MKTGDLTPMPALIGEALEALMLLERVIGQRRKTLQSCFHLAESPGGGTMNETSVRPAESSDAPWEASWSCSPTARSSSTSMGSDTAKVELAPAGRREGDEGVVNVNGGLNTNNEKKSYYAKTVQEQIGSKCKPAFGGAVGNLSWRRAVEASAIQPRHQHQRVIHSLFGRSGRGGKGGDALIG